MQNILPVTNEHGYFEIRLESIGGLGANLCGKMLGELGALYLSLNASSFSSYGSEKRGSPVKAYVRWCDSTKPIRINSPIITPHILCIFHEGLLGKHPVLNGVTADTKIIVNTTLSSTEAAKKWGISKGTLYCIDALSIAMECKSRINMVLLGAIVKVSGFIPLSSAEELCRETIGQKYPALIESNLKGLHKGYAQLSEGMDAATGSAPDMDTASATTMDAAQSGNTTPPPLATGAYTWGYDNAPLGGVNPRAGSTVSNDLSPSREGYIPLFIQDRCINCGLCDSTCPDMVFQFKPGIYKDKPAMVNCGLDYYHCKGCLRCVDVCPTNALVQALEKDYPEKPWFVAVKDLLPDNIEYEKSGANSWITSDSYTDEKREDGGVV